MTKKLSHNWQKRNLIFFLKIDDLLALAVSEVKVSIALCYCITCGPIWKLWKVMKCHM